MGTYRQPGIYVHKGYEQFNKAMAQGNKNFLAAYANAEKNRTANAKANAASLAEARKGYQNWGKIINKVQKDNDMQFDIESLSLLKRVGKEYYEKVGSTDQKDIDRITQLDSYPEQLMRILASGEAISKQYKKSFAIDKGKGAIDEDRTPSNNISYAHNIANENGSLVKPIEVIGDDGLPTGNLAVNYNNGKAGDDALDFNVNGNELYEELMNEDSAFQFIFTKGDLKETLNPYLDLAKGEVKLSAENKKVKGDRWYADATNYDKGTTSYEEVLPTDSSYNEDTPYRKTITYTTQHGANREELKNKLSTVSMTSLMGSDGASWMFSDIINWARTKYPADKNLQEGGADQDAATTDDNLFNVDEAGDLVSIPWIQDPAGGLTQYSSTGSFQETSKLQQDIFQKYAQAWMLDPDNGLIPPESSKNSVSYISKRQYDAFSATPARATGGRSATNLDREVSYANKPAEIYTSPRFPDQPLTPYQYDVESTKDVLFNITPGTGGEAPTLSTQRRTQPETMSAIVNILNDSNMAGESYKEPRKGYPKEFMDKSGLSSKLDTSIANATARLAKTNISPADKATNEALILKYKKQKLGLANAGENILYYVNDKNEVITQKINLTGTLPKVEEDVQRLFHKWNGIFGAVKEKGDKMKNI